MQFDIVIIGGGLSGLTAAMQAESLSDHTKIALFESSNTLGGRVKSDKVDGFILDHGFQVFLSDYPYASSVFNEQELGFEAFKPGAFIATEEGSTIIGDPNREPGQLLSTIFSSVGSLSDKFKIWKLSNELKKISHDECFNINMSTRDYLKEYGFSEKIIQKFFQPFFGGIFLERDLETSAGMFRFVFKNFAKGSAVLPKNGMQALPEYLAKKLSRTEVRVGKAVKSIEQDGKINFENGDSVMANKIIMAADPSSLIQQLDQEVKYHSTVTLYFTGSSDLKKMNRLIGLDAAANSPINNIARLDEVQPSYAPKGKSLWSITLREEKYDEESVRQRLSEIIECTPDDLNFLSEYRIKKALPILQAPKYKVAEEQSQLTEKLYLAGDYLLNASIEGAMISGKIAATAVSESLELKV